MKAVEPTALLLRQPAHLNCTQGAVLRTARVTVTNSKEVVTFVFGASRLTRRPALSRVGIFAVKSREINRAPWAIQSGENTSDAVRNGDGLTTRANVAPGEAGGQADPRMRARPWTSYPSGADAAKPAPVPKVEVPKVVTEVSDVVRALVGRMQLAVTEPTMERALQILQAIANECAKRGWSLELDNRDDRRFQITTTECSFELLLREELVDAELPDSDTLAAAKYPWQRVPMHVSKIGSGRLTLQLGQYYRTRSWSDRSRWRLDDKLGALFVELDNRVADAADKRREREADLLRRQHAWDEAAAAAKQAYVFDLNRRRLSDQVGAHRRAQELRAYANHLNDVADGVADAVGESIRRWQRFARAEADRIDPTRHTDRLGYLEPDTVSADDFAPFMPKGMNAHRRPTQ